MELRFFGKRAPEGFKKISKGVWKAPAGWLEQQMAQECYKGMGGAEKLLRIEKELLLEDQEFDLVAFVRDQIDDLVKARKEK